MELKEYQIKTLGQIKNYLQLLSEWKKRAEKNPDLEIDFSEKAWEKASVDSQYISRKNGLGKPLPNFCLKIPTGGGKTFLAVKTIDLINSNYIEKKTGLILWIVPTNQIYSQTIKSLRDRNHPYRQHLDIASGGRTLILERTEKFSPLDIQENLVILMLMLPAASRENKDTLRMFRDSGGFQDFFPAEDKIEEHIKMLKKYPNLDVFGDKNNFWGRQIKTSLGNTLRILNPIIILDEGHKAYSEIAQDTLRKFNPSIIVELSATPSEKSNILIDVRGTELNREEMIKLDLHIINKASPDWKETLLDSVNRRNILEEKAVKYEANTGNYIRPICLIQTERTGREQRGGKYIHSEDVREHLAKIIGISPEQIAVTSAELKELEGHDLLSRDCPIRYIITKQALQEGWDCPFAYVLSILNNPASKNSLTQLVGRILRQPYARKTKIAELDESYVFTFRQRAADLLGNIRKGFEREGLGDLRGFIYQDNDLETETKKESFMRKKFEKSTKNCILPVFSIKDGKNWRQVNYETDIVSRIDWTKINLDALKNLALSGKGEKDMEHIATISDQDELLKQKEVKKIKENGLKIDEAFLARNLLDVVCNPWIAFEIGEKVISSLLKKFDKKIIANNFVFIVEEIKKHLISEKDNLSKKIFDGLMQAGEIRFLIIGNDIGYKFPKKISVKSSSITLSKSDGQPLQMSLFDFVPLEDFNEIEKSVALYLEDQDKLFFWYRNRPKQDYALQGWRKQKIYPDFIFAQKDFKKDFKKVFVVETKGIHLKNEDTAYKQSVFDLCNEKAREIDLNELGIIMENRPIQFEVVYTDEWKRRFNEMFV